MGRKIAILAVVLAVVAIAGFGAHFANVGQQGAHDGGQGANGASGNALNFGSGVAVTLRMQTAKNMVQPPGANGYQCVFTSRVENGTKYHLHMAQIVVGAGSLDIGNVAANSAGYGGQWTYYIPSDNKSCHAVADTLAGFVSKAHVTECQMESLVEGDCQNQFAIKTDFDYAAIDAYDKDMMAVVASDRAKNEAAHQAELEKKRQGNVAPGSYKVTSANTYNPIAVSSLYVYAAPVDDSTSTSWIDIYVGTTSVNVTDVKYDGDRIATWYKVDVAVDENVYDAAGTRAASGWVKRSDLDTWNLKPAGGETPAQ